jgi:methionine biosynthesis protein MetW
LVIEKGAKILDLGCGEGDLLNLLTREKQVTAQGIEKDDRAIQECVKKGVSVFHDDIESGLREYPDNSFDYVILNQSMEEIKNVESLIHDALRIGNRIIISFPNFAYYKSRVMLFFRGRAPVTKSLPYSWFDTPNVRFLTITDFRDFCIQKKIRITGSYFLGERREIKIMPNLFALNAIFILSRGEVGK